MVGNISKTNGIVGDRGEQGPQGIQGIQGEKGEKGDTPGITFFYDEKTGDLSYKSDGILLDREYVDSNNLVTKEELASLKDIINLLQAKSLVKTITINLPASNWVGEGNNYSQVVSIADITEYSKVDLQPTAEQLVIFHEKDITFVAENEDGIVTIYCIGQKPTLDYDIQATVTEIAQD